MFLPLRSRVKNYIPLGGSSQLAVFNIFSPCQHPEHPQWHPFLARLPLDLWYADIQGHIAELVLPVLAHPPPAA